MTAPPSSPPETVPSEQYRLIINGELVRPEELGRSLSPSVLLRLRVTKEPYVPPVPPRHTPPPAPVEALPAWTLVVSLALLGLGLAALLLLW